MRETSSVDENATLSAASPTPALPPGDHCVAAPVVRGFGDYELIEMIARGGMGVVFKARQISLNRTVAVKMILAGSLATPADVQRFRAEAEAAANLDHPNILPIHEVGEHEGQHFFSMKFIDGGSLSEWFARLRKTSIDGEKTRRVVQQIVFAARAVHFAHQRGILHRDLKPANILLDADGVSYVTDFGLAKRVEGDSGLTQTGAILGTPSYMAPEQARADKQLSTAVDVYGLGAILYEFLTGRPPFSGPTFLDTLLAVIERDPSWPSGCDRDLATIAMKCLEKEPSRRYESAAALADELERWVKLEPIVARPAGRTERAWKWVKRRPVVSALLAGLGLTLIAALGTLAGMLWFARQFNDEAVRRAGIESDRRHDAEVAIEKQKTLTTQANDRLVQSQLEQARAERVTGHRQRALDLLANVVKARGPSLDLRQEAIQAIFTPEVRLRCMVGPCLLIAGREEYISQFSADGALLAAANAEYRKSPDNNMLLVKQLEVWEIPGGKRIAQFPAEFLREGRAFAFSPIESVLAYFHEKQIFLWRPRTNETLRVFKGIPPLCFSPDGKWLVFRNTWGLSIVVADLATGQTRTLSTLGDPIAFVTDDELLVRTSNQLQRWNVRTAARTWSAPEHLAFLVDSHFDGRFALLVSDKFPKDEHGELWDVVAGVQVGQEIKIPTKDLHGAMSVNEATGIVAVPDPNDRLQFRLWDARGPRLALRSPRLAGEAGRSSWRPDGSLLAVQEGRNGPVRIWDVHAARPLTLLPDERPVWSRDGRWLVTFGDGQITSTDGDTRITSRWRKPDGRCIYEITKPVQSVALTGPAREIAFSSDGRRLATAEATWDVVDRPSGSSLRLSAARPAANKLRVSSDWGRVWTLPIWYVGDRLDTLELRQVFPESLEVALPRPIEPVKIPLPSESGGFKTYPPASVAGCGPGMFCVNSDGTRLLVQWCNSVQTQKSGSIFRGPESFSFASQWELWDIPGRKRLSIWRGDGDGSYWDDIHFSSDGSALLAHNRSQSHEIWDASTGKSRGFLQYMEKTPGQTTVRRLEHAIWLPDSRRVFGRLDDNSLAVFDAATLQAIRRWRGPEGELTALAVSADGRTAAIAHKDHIIRLWDIDTGAELARWEAHDADIATLAFRPDGNSLVSTDADGLLKLWNLAYLRSELRSLNLDW
jgi:eukaryotic-like serine/threonine-protein kinase